ncbi:hypothetical protein BDZ45DRAFT_264310 [Acephala macrosclerotiorum]|nr:hypothetical protein BDZ45DRAFT_264310 [Acephala macrosclerotiorum]
MRRGVGQYPTSEPFCPKRGLRIREWCFLSHLLLDIVIVFAAVTLYMSAHRYCVQILHFLSPYKQRSLISATLRGRNLISLQPQPHSTMPLFFKRAQGGVLFFHITSILSFLNSPPPLHFLPPIATQTQRQTMACCCLGKTRLIRDHRLFLHSAFYAWYLSAVSSHHSRS